MAYKKMTPDMVSKIQAYLGLGVKIKVIAKRPDVDISRQTISKYIKIGILTKK